MTGPPVVCDLRAIQSPDHRGRGIGRWSYEMATALERMRPDLVAAYLLNPAWPPPGAVDELLSSGKLCYDGTAEADRAFDQARVYHCFSPVELSLPVSELRPRRVDELGLSYSAVLYDLIPLRHLEEYLVHPSQRRRYHVRLEVLRAADALLAISSAAASDAAALLHLHPGHIATVGTGVSRHFTPPLSRVATLAALRDEMPEITGPFLLYLGGDDGRKNIAGLIAAFARLPAAVRESHQLVVVGDLPPLTAHHYRHLAGIEGVADRLVLTGFVSDERLVCLYQACELFVFPSLAEGYGLPVGEALACGAVCAVSDRPPFDELVPVPDARFDPGDVAAMAAVIERCLLDEPVREAVSAAAAHSVHSWDDVASRAATVLDGLARRERHPLRPRRKVAIVSPFPPLRSGVATYSERLVDALEAETAGETEGLEIDCYVDGLPRRGASPPTNASASDARHFEEVDAAIGGYERIVYVLGNSEFHSNALTALRRRRGLVLSHEVRLSGLMTLAASVPGAVPGGLSGVVARNYEGLPPGVGRSGALTQAERDRYGVLCLREVLRHTDRLLVSSEPARLLASLDAGPELSERVGVLPFPLSWFSEDELALVESARASKKTGPFRIASFGIVDPSKRPDTLVSALAELRAAGVDAELALVGEISSELASEINEKARRLGVDGQTTVTGEVEREQYLRYLGEADIAVQLRLRFFGEASAAVSECLSAGVATVVSRIGWMSELPADTVASVPHECTPAELCETIAALLADPERRAELGRAGRRYTEEHTFAETARVLLSELRL